MATKKHSKPKLVAVAAPAAPSFDDVVGELYEIDALLAGADSTHSRSNSS